MKLLSLIIRSVGVAAALLSLLHSTALAQGTGFTYQGRLNDGDSPANGAYDLECRVFDEATNGEQRGPTLVVPGTGVSNGLFTVILDFGTNVFAGRAAWLNLAVRPAGSGLFTTLSPRQRITPAPYAIYANSAEVAAGLKGSVTVPGTITAQGFVGSAAGLTNFNLAGLRLSSLDAPDGQPARALFVDDAGRVGIGTGTPLLGKLDVAGGSVVADNGQGFFSLNPQRTGIGAGIFAGSDSSLRLTAGNKLLATLATNGNFGIGITQPSARLSLGSDVGLEKFALVDGSSGNSMGLGATSTEFRLHLGSGASRFGFHSASSSTTPLMTLAKDGQVELLGQNGQRNVVLGALPGFPGNGSVGVHDSAGTEKASMTVDANGKGKLRCDYIQIYGGADIAEPFEVRGDAAIQPGMVVVIDPERPGELRLSNRAYDPTVAGIISGANGVRPGLTLQQTGTVADGKHPVALTGRVWCHCDADAGGPIAPGDLLTSADAPGHAMKARNQDRSFGAIIGKAMTPLSGGKGLVLVLVSLQ